MAGLGRKVFNAGEVLSAANVQGYLQDQVVQVYSGTAARSSALGTAVSEGMTSYLTDSNELSVYTSNGTAAWSPVNLSQSPNAIINGAFDFNQRNFTSITANDTYGFDRWKSAFGSGGGTTTITPQVFTPGVAPVAGYEGTNYVRLVTANQTAAGDWSGIYQRIEDARTFAGQTATVSFWAKAASGTPKIGITVRQIFGAGGSATTTVSSVTTISTSWARYSFTVNVPSLVGKTMGTGQTVLDLFIFVSDGATLVSSGYADTGLQNNTFDLWGVQLEAGSVATPFRRNAPSLQGELAACQRYFIRFANGNETSTQDIAIGQWYSTTVTEATVRFPVPLRTTPTLAYSNVAHFKNVLAANGYTASAVNMYNQSNQTINLSFISTGGTAGYAAKLSINNQVTAYLDAIAEL